MAQLLVRNIDDSVVSRLKEHARRHGRSLQAEVKSILERASQNDLERARKVANRIRRRIGRRQQTDSAVLLREDRER
jgi:plasmid stability protein